MLVWKLSLPSWAAVHPHRIFSARRRAVSLGCRAVDRQDVADVHARQGFKQTTP